jgi:hypothetical protein
MSRCRQGLLPMPTITSVNALTLMQRT